MTNTIDADNRSESDYIELVRRFVSKNVVDY
jgi:hypothetical protein